MTSAISHVETDESTSTDSPKRRVLFFGEAVTLAHVARPHLLANSLNSNSYETALACDARYNALFDDSAYQRLEIDSISNEQFMDALARGKPVFNFETLCEYVQRDLEVIDEFKPDAVAGDFRLSLRISARLRNVPYANITNAYWSPFASQHFPVPGHPMVQWFGVSIAQALFNLSRPMVFALHTRPMNRTLRHFGLPRLGNCLQHVYTDADLTLYADIPELVETHNRPANHRYIGPVIWSPKVSRPEWWDQIPEERPLVYVTPGSSGQSNQFSMILDALEELPINVIASTAGKFNLREKRPNVWVADYLPGVEAAMKSDLVICNGGSPTTHQALSVGKPVLGIPTNLDQYLNMQAVKSRRGGDCLRSDRVSKTSLQQTVLHMLGDDDIAAGANDLKKQFSQWNSATRFEQAIDDLIRERSPKRSNER